jgi:predicted KAP-like P-loop ATPase
VTNEKKQITDYKKIREIFEELEVMLLNRNPQCINMIDDIRAIPWSEELVNQIENYEFKQALDELSVLKDRFG